MDCMREKFVPGEILDGRFQTVAPLNHGSFGMVFLAKDLNTGESVAIKCLTKPSTTDLCPSALAIDDRSEELACHARLGYHPNIVNLIHSFETRAHVYLVLEYCSMGDLYEAIRLGRGPLETEHVRDFLLQLVNAVEFMHSKGLAHRDIKPENIFLMHDGSMKLGDFGLATTSEWSHESCVGSDRYMAPEQYDPAGVGYSPVKADIWSIGICLLNVLFSRNPFVTPTETDLLFADYRRDRQSLFDVFPNMSQDTFEILSIAMALDPEKRSLDAVRDAINRAVSFTIDDESLDEFCTEDRDVVRASANREPLRTPSLQSPHISQSDSFPWAKALQASPQQPVRQLSVIPDEESYTEELFPASEKGTESWYSVHAQTPSMASVLDSALGASFKSMAIRRPEKRMPPRSDPVPITGSLPGPMTKPLPAMSHIFGKKRDPISKSWSELWDEDEEELEQMDAIQQRREQNSRSWSHESKDNDITIRPGGLMELKSSSFVNTRTRSPEHSVMASPAKISDDMDENESAPVDFRPRSVTPRRSPPRQSIMEKWAALGNKRRAFQTKDDNVSTPKSKPTKVSGMDWRRDWGLGSSGFDYGAWNRNRSAGRHLDRDWRRDSHENLPQPQVKPYVISRDSGYHDDVDDDLEWVGGWHDLHL